MKLSMKEIMSFVQNYTSNYYWAKILKKKSVSWVYDLNYYIILISIKILLFPGKQNEI